MDDASSFLRTPTTSYEEFFSALENIGDEEDDEDSMFYHTAGSATGFDTLPLESTNIEDDLENDGIDLCPQHLADDDDRMSRGSQSQSSLQQVISLEALSLNEMDVDSRNGKAVCLSCT